MSLGAPLPGNCDLDDLGGAEDLDATQLPSPGLSQDPSERSTPPLHGYFGLPVGDIDDLWSGSSIHLDDLKTSAAFARELQHATFDNPSCGLSYEALERLRNPPRDQPSSSIDEDTRLAIDLYLGIQSEKGYEVARAAILRRLPTACLPTYYKVKRLVAELSGVESVVHDMCVNSCVAYTGPFLDLDACPVCSEPRYDQFRFETSDGKDRTPRQEFHTIPIGPQIQALYRAPESAVHAHYLRKERSRVLSEYQSKGCLDEYSDVLHGADLIDTFEDRCIEEDDIVLMFLINRAQLYARKASACWIYIWVLFNLPPSMRYKKKFMFIGSFIPGPNNLKNLNSFLLLGLQHLVSLQKEGI
jgi:hypothetical protein